MAQGNSDVPSEINCSVSIWRTRAMPLSLLLPPHCSTTPCRQKVLSKCHMNERSYLATCTSKSATKERMSVRTWDSSWHTVGAASLKQWLGQFSSSESGPNVTAVIYEQQLSLVKKTFSQDSRGTVWSFTKCFISIFSFVKWKTITLS